MKELERITQSDVAYVAKFWDYINRRLPVMPLAKDHGLTEEDATWLKAYCQRELHERRSRIDKNESNVMRPRSSEIGPWSEK